MTPEITSKGPLTRLTSEVAVPSKFAARFDRSGVSVTLDLEVEAGRVVCRSASVSRTKGRLTVKDLRLPLATEMIPAAVEAASQTVVLTISEFGDHQGTPPDFDEHLHVAVTQFAKLESDRNRYRAVARAVGRPKLVASKADLRKMISYYLSSGGSLALTAAEFHVSTATVNRRLNEARDLGLLKERRRK